MPMIRLNSLRSTAIRRTSSLGARRSFQSGNRLAVGKESDLHRENTGNEKEAVKQEQLKKQKEGRAEWSDSLSSDSESIVKADRGEVKNARDTIQELQQEGAKAAERERDMSQ